MHSSFHSLPAEWAPQSTVIMALPHPDTDWNPILPGVLDCYRRIIYKAKDYARILVLAPDTEYAKKALAIEGELPQWLTVHEYTTNDTWTRDYGFITTELADGEVQLLDFTFNGWGMKFAACFDNMACRHMAAAGLLPKNAHYSAELDFVLEGGSIESDGQGTLLTTAECLMSPNRNPAMTHTEIEERLKHSLGAKRVLWLEHGSLEGDDTDSHIDTLARFISPTAIAYSSCTNEADPNYAPLKLMEEELRNLRTDNGAPYDLVALPIPAPIYHEDDGHQLPATYANFLIINGAVLLPVYADEKADATAIEALAKAMPNHKIIPIDCRALIKQHGSLHCATMQTAADFSRHQ